MGEWDLSDWEKEFETVAKDTMDSGVEETEDKSIKLYKEKTFQVLKHIEEMILPKNKEQLRVITKRSFNSIAFVKFIAELEIIKHIVLVIYSINHEAAVILDDLIRTGKIQSATILISNLRNKAHRKKEQLTKDLFIDNPKIKLIFASSHAKVISFETEKNNYYTIEGSGNLSYNSRIEQYIIDNDKDVYDFTVNWIEEILIYLKGKKELTIYE